MIVPNSEKNHPKIIMYFLLIIRLKKYVKLIYFNHAIIKKYIDSFWKWLGFFYESTHR